jgi:hypothetical protein
MMQARLRRRKRRGLAALWRANAGRWPDGCEEWSCRARRGRRVDYFLRTITLPME